MIPQTAAAVIAFLLLVTPGLLFEWLRRLSRPRVERSAFEEVSTVAVASLVFSMVAIVIVAAVASSADALVNLEEWVKDPDHYAPAHLWQIVVSLAVEVAVACVLVVLANWAINSECGAKVIATLSSAIGTSDKASPFAATMRALVTERPANTSTIAGVTMKSGVQISGKVALVDDELDGSIVLTGDLRTIRDSADVALGPDWTFVIVPCGEIASIAGRYEKKV